MNKFTPKSFPGAKSAGFTLIELLVVVLIIGILASVALPQYQLAVQKTRTMRLVPLLRAISDAENVYYMANGTYTVKFEDLDIEMPGGGTRAEVSETVDRINYGDFFCYLRTPSVDSQVNYSAYCNDNRASAPSLEKYFSRNYFICWGDGAGSLAWRVCQGISGRSEPDTSTGERLTGFSF